MSYAMAAGLQQAVYQHLIDDAAVAAGLGGAIYDVLPAGALPQVYAVLGQEEARDASDKTGAGARHEFSVAVISDGSGYLQAKTAAAAICDALVDADLALPRGRLVALRFLRARARQEGAGQIRRIDLRFAARLEDDE